MTPKKTWTRRTFVQSMGSFSALSGAGVLASWAQGSSPREQQRGVVRFAYVSSADHAIGVFSIAPDGSWTPVQTVHSAYPVAMALSRDQSFLYVANAVDRYGHLPTGSVEAYAIDSQAGCLNLLNREPLAISATRPRRIAVSPDGRQLGVAVAGGAAYNLLPVHEDGSLGQVTASLKQIGAGPDLKHQARAMPSSVLFHSDGILLGTDLGSDRLSSFTLDGGGALRERARHLAQGGSGPAHIVAHPHGNIYYTAGALDPVISSVRYVTDGDHFFEEVQGFRLTNLIGSITSLAIDASGSLLFAAHERGIALIPTDASGTLGRPFNGLRFTQASVALSASSDGQHLFAADNARGRVMRFDVSVEHARLSCPVELTRMTATHAFVLKDRSCTQL